MAQRRFWTPDGLPRRCAALVAAAALALAFLPGVALAGTATEPPGQWHLNGKVTGQDGQGLAGLGVCAQTPAVKWYCNNTASGGSYRIVLPPSPTDYLLFVGPDIQSDPSATYSGGCYNASEPGNLAPEFGPGQPLPPDGDCTTLTIATPDTSGIDVVEPFVRTVSGHVYGADGGPVAGVSVRDVSRWGWGVGTQTASDGSYSLWLAQGTSYVLVLGLAGQSGPLGCYDPDYPGNLGPAATLDPLALKSGCTPLTMAGTNMTGIDVTLGTTATPMPAPTPTPEPTATVAPTPAPAPTLGPATQIRVETAADGSGAVVSAQDLALGSSLTVYAITRDATGHFVARVDATWGLSDRTGGVVPTDLWGPSGGAYATLFGNAIGTAVIQAVRGNLTPVDSGVITIGPSSELMASGSTPVGTNVAVSPLNNDGSSSGISLTFADVSSAGMTSVAISNAGPPLTGDFNFFGSPLYYDVSTTATHSGAITLCLPFAYDPNNGGPYALLHWNGTRWDNLPISYDAATGAICGTVSSLSPFVVVQRLSAPAASPSAGPAGSTSGSSAGGLVVGLLIVLVLLAAAAIWWLSRRRKAHGTGPGDPPAGEADPEVGSPEE